MESFKWDAFVSHASEDKESFVIPLVEELEKYGLRIWFDDFTLRIGDSLRRSIETGLASSRYGIVVLSPSFFAKNWPQSELDGLFARQMEGQDVILPIWHEITKEDLLARVPMLVDKKAAKSSDGAAKVAKELVRVLRPDALQLDTSRKDAQNVNARLLDQLREKNTTLDFRVSVGPRPDPEILPFQSATPRSDVSLAQNSGMRIEVVVKDKTEYAKNPVTFSVTFKGTGIDKIRDALRTGKAQEFSSEEFSNFKSSLNLFGPVDSGVPGQKLFLGPSARTTKKIPVRVTFRNDSSTIQFSYTEMQVERAGTDEGAIIIRGSEIPFSLRLIVSRDRLAEPRLEIEHHIQNAEVHAVQKFVRAMQLVSASGAVEVVDLNSDSVAFSGDCKFEGHTNEQGVLASLIDDVVVVADYFGLSVRWPTTISEQDVEFLMMLKSLVDGTSFATGATFTSVVRKSEENASLMDKLQPMGQIVNVWEDPITFFGTSIKDQTFAILMDQVRIKDFESVKQRFTQAVLGEEIEISYETKSPLFLKLWDKDRGCAIERPATGKERRL